MGTAAGDKIGLTTATPGGSSGVWGTEYYAHAVAVDEFIYASREDRNNIISGGGKISWDGSDVTFDANLTIQNFITAYKNSITTAASPVTLDASGKFGYVQISRKPASDNTITSALVQTAGNLPNGTTDADQGTLILFYRDTDGSLVIPWARKRLIAGDHYVIGRGMTYFEYRAARYGQPVLHNAADTSQVYVDATPDQPSCVLIGGRIYANTSDETCDLDTSGRGGLDTGTKAAYTKYFVYAIPASSGTTYDLICSEDDPDTGPTGFTEFTYIGYFFTGASSAVLGKDAEDRLTRRASAKRPNWSRNSSDATQIIVPGSTAAPAAVMIDGELYFNMANETMDINTSGRGGLDTGSVASSTLYYLYAIPATSGRGFDLVCSVTAPTTGPTGFSAWSYLGSFATDGSSDILGAYCDGQYVAGNIVNSVTVTETSATAKSLTIPASAKEVLLRIIVTAITAAGNTVVVGQLSSENATRWRTSTTTASQSPVVFTWVPVVEAQTIYASVTGASTSATLNVFGWKEDPTEYK
mgnify:CR=1 FL=1|jgi:hypothetical protein